MNKAMREQIISFLSEVATFAMEQQRDYGQGSRVIAEEGNERGGSDHLLSG